MAAGYQVSGGAQGPGPVHMLLQNGACVGEQPPLPPPGAML